MPAQLCGEYGDAPRFINAEFVDLENIGFGGQRKIGLVNIVCLDDNFFSGTSRLSVSTTFFQLATELSKSRNRLWFANKSTVSTVPPPFSTASSASSFVPEMFFRVTAILTPSRASVTDFTIWAVYSATPHDHSSMFWHTFQA
jgi:hypothetical protein